MKGIEAYWYREGRGRWLLAAPLLNLIATLFCALVGLRRFAYHHGVLRSRRLPVPVVVVGNITAGGAGKTPLVLWLVEWLRAAGHRPGVVSRGYRGRAGQWPQAVTADSDPALVGDEPVLIAARAGCPVSVGPDRVAAAEALLATHDCDILVTDDGLQHYRLGRDVEIAVVDGVRRLGNRRCLPAGPLREPPRRLREVDLVVLNGCGDPGEWVMTLVPGAACPLAGGEPRPLEGFRGETVHAVAGIGNPVRFFNALRGHGMEVIEHPFADHHDYTPEDLDFGDGRPVLMTEKDAVKCRRFAQPGQWYVPVETQLPEAFDARLATLLKR